MLMRLARPRMVAVVVGCLAVGVVGGCKLGWLPERPVPLPHGADPEYIRDINNIEEPPLTSVVDVLRQKSNQEKAVIATVRKAQQQRYDDYQKRQSSTSPEASSALLSNALLAVDIVNPIHPPPAPPKPYKMLSLSGGGMYGAYTAGVMAGWTDSGTRPTFDVIAGISAGALVGAAVYGGPEYDVPLRDMYTSVTNKDLFTITPGLIRRAITQGGIAVNSGEENILKRFFDAEYYEKVAAAHEAGRRFYVGTANVDTGRFVIWDMGAIAVRRTPEARELYRKVILASTTFPGFLAPVPIDVEIDGHRYQEFHVDGGTTRGVFFHPPVNEEGRPAFDYHALDGSDLYLVIAGKVYMDPVGTPPQFWSVLLRSVSTLLDSATRSELFRIFCYAMYAGANFHMAAIPPEYEMPAQSMKFLPDVTSRLFTTGYNQVRCEWATMWSQDPPELDPRESLRTRRGSVLTTAPAAQYPPKPRMLPKAVARTTTESAEAVPSATTATPLLDIPVAPVREPRRPGPRPSPRLPSSIIP